MANEKKALAAQAKESRLADAVDALLNAASTRREHEGNPRPEEVLLGRFAGETLLASNPEVGRIADSILEQLGPNQQFQGAWEVLAFCLDRLEHIQAVDPEYEVDAARTQIARDLLEPSRAFSFIVASPTVSSVQFEIKLTEPSPLSVFVSPPDGVPGSDGATFGIFGAVKAATAEGAILSVERVVDAVVGGLRATGLARFVPSRFGTFKRPRLALTTRGPSGEEEAHPLALAAAYGDRLTSTYFRLPSDLSELEQTAVRSGNQIEALARHRRMLTRVLGGTSQRAAELRNACRLAINAEHSSDFGLAVTLAFSCLEGLLLPTTSKDDKLSALSEAVAHSLGGPVEDKNVLRSLVKKLYDVRSRFVHTGIVAETSGARESALTIMYRVLRREIEHLPEVSSDP